MSSPSPQARRFTRNFTWLATQEALVGAINLMIAIYLARTLGPASYGSLGLALSIVGIVTTVVREGSGPRATRQTALNPDNVPEIYAQVVGFRVVNAGAGIILLSTLAPLLSITFSFSATLLIFCSFLLVRPALTVVWAFRGLDRMHINAAANVTEKAATLLGLLLLVEGEGNDVLWAPIVEAFAAVLMVWWSRKRLKRIYPRLAIEFRPRDWPNIARESIPLGLAALMSGVSLHGAVLLLGGLATPALAAGFLVAQKIMLKLALPMVVLCRAAFPSTSRLISRDGSDALEMLARLMRYYLIMVIPVLGLVAFHAEDVLTVLFGSAYSGMGPVLIALLAALPIRAMNSSLETLLKAIPRPGSLLACRTVGVGVLLGLGVVLIPWAGALGAAVAVVGGDFASMTVLVILVQRATRGLPVSLRCISPVVAGAVAAAAYWAFGELPISMRLPLVASVYFAAMWLAKGVTAGEIRSLSRLILQGARLKAES